MRRAERVLVGVLAFAIQCGDVFAQSSSESSEPYQRGTELFKGGDVEGSFLFFAKAAELGGAEAQLLRKCIYGVGSDDGQLVLAGCRPLAERGDVVAETLLGVVYETGEQGLPRNYPEAIGWLRLAVKQGSAPAMLTLGQMYEEGEGVTKNPAIALKLDLQARANALKGASEFAEMVEADIARLSPAPRPIIRQACANRAKRRTSACSEI